MKGMREGKFRELNYRGVIMGNFGPEQMMMMIIMIIIIIII